MLLTGVKNGQVKPRSGAAYHVREENNYEDEEEHHSFQGNSGFALN